MICNLCKRLSDNAITNCMSGQGNINADIMFVGALPSEMEDQVGSPFTGIYNRYFKKHIFSATGITESEVYLTYAVRCASPKSKIPSIREARFCRKYLVEEVRKVKPKVIILLGDVALHVALQLWRKKTEEKEKKSGGMKGIAKWRGKKIWHGEFGCWVVPTWSPKELSTLRKLGVYYKEEQTISDVNLAISSIDTKVDLLKAEIFTVDSDRVRSAIRYLKNLSNCKRKILSVDIETSGFDIRKDVILGISFSYKKNNTYLGFYIHWDNIIRSSTVRNLVNKILSDPDKIKILQNGSFDAKFLRYQGFEFSGTYYDTMFAANLVDENFPTGLKDLTWRYLTFGGYDSVLDDYKRENKVTSYADIPFGMLSEYGALDAIATFKIWELLESIIRKQGSWNLLEKLVIPSRKVFTEMELTGFAVNRAYSQKLSDTIDMLVDKLNKRIFKLAGEEFNVNSRPQLANILYKKLKLPIIDLTATGNPSTKIETLEKLISYGGKGGKLSEVLVDIGYIKKQQSTFIKPMLDPKYVWEDGRVHTKYHTTGTVTGRASCSDPGIHGVTRDKAIRAQFIAPKGCVLISADIKSAELRALAVYSQEETLLKAFREGRDVHNETYNMMFDKPNDYVPTDEERQIAKTINFGLIYGMSAYALAVTLGVEPDTASDYIEIYFEKLPKAKRYLDSVIRRVRKNKTIKSLFGRIRRLPDINCDDYKLRSRIERQAKNSIIQSTAADFTFLLLARVYKTMLKKGLKAKIVHTVHDSIIIETPISEIEIVKNILNSQVDKPVKGLTVPMLLDIDVLPNNWGDDKKEKDSKIIKIYNKITKGDFMKDIMLLKVS